MSTPSVSRLPALTRAVRYSPSLMFRDEPTFLHMEGLLSPEFCDAVAARLRTLSLVPYAATTGSDAFAPIPKLGPALFEYHDELHQDRSSGLQAYFDQARIDSDLLRSLFAETALPDPLDVLHKVGEALLGQAISVATENGHHYFSGVVRDINMGAIPHYDDASIDTPDLVVGQTDRQLSLLFYLTDFVGGGLTAFAKKPSPLDNTENAIGYGYKPEAVQGVSFQGVVPSKGSVVVFNPRYIHSVAPVLGDQRRLTFSAFIGRHSASGELISWS